MTTRSVSPHRFAGSLLALLLMVAGVAFAGPPLVCHTFDIGSAKSLPWISHSWNLTGTESYDTSKLVSDTLAILAADPTVLVHMETLRRATLYARKNPAAARELLAKLTAGTKSLQTGAPPALYYFDVGYLAETYKQWLGENTQNPATGIDGYALVKQAIQLRGHDPQMEFAAARARFPAGGLLAGRLRRVPSALGSVPRIQHFSCRAGRHHLGGCRLLAAASAGG